MDYFSELIMQDIISQFKHLNFIIKMIEKYWLAITFTQLKSNRKYLGYYEVKDFRKKITIINCIKIDYIQYGENLMRLLWGV